MKTGVSRFSIENFWSHNAEKFRGHPFNVSEILGYRKMLRINRKNIWHDRDSNPESTA